MSDRLTIESDGTIDELVMSDAFVHLEHLGGGAYMLIVENARDHIHLTLPVKTTWRGLPRAFVYERFVPTPHDSENT